MTDNGTFNGALGRAISNQIDIALTAFFIKDYFTRDAEFTVAVYSDQLCCYVPKAARVPQSILPLFSFSWDMWMCYCFSAITCAVIWSLIRCVNLVLFKYNASSYGVTWNVLHFLQIFIDTWIVWVRVSLRKFPGFGSEKLFLGSVCLVSVIFGAVFESSLATVYIKPLYYKDISTLQELDATGLKILYKYASMGDDLFAKGSSDLFNKLESKLRLVVFKESVMGTMVKKGDFASVTRESSISLESIQYFAANKLYMVPECPKTYTLAYVLPKDSPFANRINLLLLQFLNAGLIDKWIDDMYFEAKLDDMNKNVKDGSQGAKVLTLNDLQLPFYVIGMGALIGFTTLAGEFYMKKR